MRVGRPFAEIPSSDSSSPSFNSRWSMCRKGKILQYGHANAGFLEALGGEAGCRRLSAEFYARVGKDPVLRPLFPGKSLRCATEEFAAFLIQFLGGDEEQTQHRWWLSLRESHARFCIGPTERSAWLKHMGATLDAAPLDEATRKALRQFFLHSSAYVIGNEAAEPEHEELAARWAEQRILDDAIGAIVVGDDHEALALAPRNLLPSVGVRWTVGADGSIRPHPVDSLRDRCRGE
jgi:hemoglobin